MTNMHIVYLLAACGFTYMFLCSFVVTVYLLDKAVGDLPKVSSKLIHLKDRVRKK